MEIRRLGREEHGDTRELYEEVFPGDSSFFVDYYYTEKTKDNRIYVIEEDERLQAMMHLNPYTLMVNGTEKEVDYIVAVATRKEYRKRGFMAALMRRALADMYKVGRAFTFLMPASEAIYLPYDFRTVYRQTPRLCNIAAKTQYVSEKELIRVIPAARKDVRELSQAAESYLSRNYQVYAKRDEAYYTRFIKELESDGGRLMLYRKGNELVDCRIFYEDGGEAQRPKIMVRIVDVRRMLMSMKLKTLMAACFTVTDPVITENNRCLTVTGTEFSGVMVMEGKEENSEGTITVSSLTNLLFGAQSAEDICEEEGTMLSERLREELKKIVPLSKLYLNEIV